MVQLWDQTCSLQALPSHRIRVHISGCANVSDIDAAIKSNSNFYYIMFFNVLLYRRYIHQASLKQYGPFPDPCRLQRIVEYGEMNCSRYISLS